jgi:hypothetical protein
MVKYRKQFIRKEGLLYGYPFMERGLWSMCNIFYKYEILQWLLSGFSENAVKGWNVCCERHGKVNLLALGRVFYAS